MGSRRRCGRRLFRSSTWRALYAPAILSGGAGLGYNDRDVRREAFERASR